MELKSGTDAKSVCLGGGVGGRHVVGLNSSRVIPEPLKWYQWLLPLALTIIRPALDQAGLVVTNVYPDLIKENRS